MQYEVGQFYRRVKDEEHGGNEGIVLSEGKVFECHVIDPDGHCWSMHATYGGDACNDGEGWCVALANELDKGSVVLLETVPYPK